METWATFSIIDHLKPIGDQTQEELAQLEAVDYLREALAGEPSFCREFTLSDAPETRMNRGGDFSSNLQKGSFCRELEHRPGQSVPRGVAADAFGFGRHFQQCFACPTPRDVK
jgi:hypothetical protein